MGLLDQKNTLVIVNNNDKAIQINKPYSDHTSMLGGAKGRHWHLLIFSFRLYIYRNNFYESACQNLDIAGFT